jgi:hypothetical protein
LPKGQKKSPICIELSKRPASKWGKDGTQGTVRVLNWRCGSANNKQDPEAELILHKT